ncbi:hypothetical protein MAR_005257, partial [Mya arenaria]
KESLIKELEATNSLLEDPVIETYYNAKFTGNTISRLPSTGVRSRLILKAMHVANTQVASKLLEDEACNTLHFDATTKFHKHYQGFQVTTKDGTSLSTGLSEEGRGDADTLHDEFFNLVEDLSRTIIMMAM